jgi:hypothetical protein
MKRTKKPGSGIFLAIVSTGGASFTLPANKKSNANSP